MVVHVSNQALLQVIYSEHLRPITVCPTRTEGIPLLGKAYLGFDLPLTFNSFLFVPSVRLLVPLGGANSTIGFPDSYRYSLDVRRELNPMKSGF
jgi:hypothetical protein